MSILYRFYQPGDAGQTNQLAHAAFEIAPFSAEIWQKMEQHDHVTVLAEEEGKIVGAIPFDLRDFLLRPGLSLRAGFAHMVCVDEKFRARGVGSGMMRFAKEHLPQFCEGMLVYTGGEGVAPYTFYEKNNFIDLQYSRFFEQDQPKAAFPPGIQVMSFIPEQIGEEVLNTCYQQAYAQYGGFPIHAPGYWRRMMEGIIYAEIPTEFMIAVNIRAANLAGYAIFGFDAEGCTILELASAASNPQEIAQLIQAAVAEAGRRGCKHIQMLASTHHPAAPLLIRAGFQPNPREDALVIAGMVFQYEALWNRLTASHPPFGLRIWTPSRRLELPGPGLPLQLEMKDSVLQRLFLCREDFQAAWEAETITSPDPRLPLTQLSLIFQPCRWVYHWFEWI
jgi:GNAT superfamily N-acetyltransferase